MAADRTAGSCLPPGERTGYGGIGRVQGGVIGQVASYGGNDRWARSARIVKPERKVHEISTPFLRELHLRLVGCEHDQQ